MSNKPFKKTALKSIFNVSSIITVLTYELSPNFCTEEESHDFWEMVYVEEGRIDCIADGISKPIKQGEIIFHKPNERHNIQCSNPDGASVFIVSFHCHSPAMRGFCNGHFKVTSELSQVIKRIMAECNRTFSVSKFSLTVFDNAAYGSLQLVRIYIEELLIKLARGESKKNDNTEDTNRTNKTGYALAQQICDYLKEHLTERISLDDISYHFHFGKSRLCDIFKQSEGDTIVSYFTKLKIAEAKRLLCEKKITVSELSRHLGFESAEYFSRTFHKHVGMSPREFRNRYS